MKSILIAILSLSAASSFGQYSINWLKIADGGGGSSGGAYHLNGTIAQYDAGGTLIGGAFSLTGGFWSMLAAVQLPGSPRLSITSTASNTAILSWPYPSFGFVLEESPIPSGGPWSPVGIVPMQTGSQWQVVVTPLVGARFYRLRYP